ncbi:mycofactocin-coupled SDR family oxidoreductase [Rhodococcus koreensis]
MGRVQGKVALVTGAARGQGRSHALRLAEEGANVIAIDICQDIESVTYPLATSKDLQETVRLIEKTDRRALAVEADVRDAAQLTKAVESGLAEFGSLDIVVANAGIAPMKSPAGLQSWIDVIGVNFIGVLNTVHATLPHLQDGASIIATGSAAAFMPNDIVQQPGKDAGGSGYMVAKNGVANYMHELARTLAPRQIRANVVHPTNCDTDMLQSDAMYKSFRPDLENPTKEDAALGFPAQQAFPIPWIDPVDVSNAVVYLASDESRYVTGMQMRIDAGSYLKFHAFHH